MGRVGPYGATLLADKVASYSGPHVRHHIERKRSVATTFYERWATSDNGYYVRHENHLRRLRRWAADPGHASAIGHTGIRPGALAGMNLFFLFPYIKGQHSAMTF